jgi:zinc protease
VDSVIVSVKSSPLTEREVQKVKNSIAVSTVTGLQSGLARAEQLAQGEVFDKNPLSYVDMLAKFGKVTAADVQRVANKYLTDGRMVMSMVPAGKLDMASKPDKPYTNVTPARPVGSK